MKSEAYATGDLVKTNSGHIGKIMNVSTKGGWYKIEGHEKKLQSKSFEKHVPTEEVDEVDPSEGSPKVKETKEIKEKKEKGKEKKNVEKLEEISDEELEEQEEYEDKVKAEPRHKIIDHANLMKSLHNPEEMIMTALDLASAQDVINMTVSMGFEKDINKQFTKLVNKESEINVDKEQQIKEIDKQIQEIINNINDLESDDKETLDEKQIHALQNKMSDLKIQRSVFSSKS